MPGFRHDVCSAIHPMGRASPFFRFADLGLDWVSPPAAVAHPLDDGTAVLLECDLRAVDLGADTDAYHRLIEPLVSAWRAVEPLVLGPFPPRLSALRALLGFAPLPGPRSVTHARSPARHSRRRPRALSSQGSPGTRCSHSSGGRAPVSRSRSPSSLTWTAGAFRAAAPRQSRTGSSASSAGQAARCTLTAWSTNCRRRMSCSPTSFPPSYGESRGCPSASTVRSAATGTGRARSSSTGRSTGRSRGALPSARRAATVHLGGTFDEIAASEWGAWRGRPVERPFVILAQHTLFDPTRAPEGKHTAWAYCHVPNGWAKDLTESVEAQVERFAPGFRDLVLGRHVTTPADFEASNRNLVGGDISGGTLDLGQAWTRPVRALNPYRTPLRGVYLCSAATPPGGGVHGMCGYSAARRRSRTDRRGIDDLDVGAVYAANACRSSLFHANGNAHRRQNRRTGASRPRTLWPWSSGSSARWRCC